MLYRVKYYSELGYVVYRHLNIDMTDEAIYIHHKTAIFVTELEATHYAAWRNLLTIQNGSDKIGI